MKKGLLITLFAVFLIGCKKAESNDKLTELKEKFHGKYEAISSIYKEPVDLNMDGFTSTDLISENPEISSCALELRILNENEQLFEEQWPVEYIVIPSGETFDSTRYHSTYSINYALYINPFFCRIDKAYKSIQLLGDLQPSSKNTLLSY